MSTGKSILNAVRHELNLSEYRKKHWEGSFDEYLDIVHQHPEVTRSAYQRLYDMILSHGTETVYENKEKLTRYKFFTEFAATHGDAIYGLDRPLMHLVNAFKSAANGTAGAAVARNGRQLQEHDRPPAQEGSGTILAHR